MVCPGESRENCRGNLGKSDLAETTEMMIRLLFVAAAVVLCGCDQVVQKDRSKNIDEAESKAKAGDYKTAIRLYEAALDGTGKTAEIHYRLGVIYDEKLRDPADALHHFQRYLELAPGGNYAKEAKAYKAEGEAKLLAKANKGPMMTQ